MRILFEEMLMPSLYSNGASPLIKDGRKESPAHRRKNDTDCFSAQLAEMHLQWFAAEDEGRTEEPTEHKIEKAREEGKVAKSPEVASSLILLLSVITLAIIAGYLFNGMKDMVRYFFGRAAEIDITKDKSILPAFYSYFIRLALPIAIVAVAGALIGNIIQVGFLFTAKPVQPDFNKIVPKFGKFFKRAIFSTEALFNLGKSIIKIIIIAVLAFINVRAEIGRIANLVRFSFLESLGVISGIAFNLLLQSAIILLLISILDYIFQKRRHTEDLKMTKQEVKEERKQYEGDPLVKNRLKQRMQELLSRNMMQNVPQADVIITNPTHYAVALEYNRETMHAPMLSAKGADNIAAKIREIAEENEVPIIENKPLARALYQDVEIGDFIPEKYYEAVVTVLSQVYKMTGKLKAVI